MKKNYSFNFSFTSQELWRVFIPGIILGCLVCGIAAFLLVDRVIMPNLVHQSRGIIPVPAIAGFGYEDARQKLYDVGLRMQIASKEYSDNVPSDHIISQEPSAGTKLNTQERRGVAVAISKGSEVADMISLNGLTEFYARKELIRNSILIGKVTRIWSDTIPEDGIVAVSITPGTRFSRETPVDLTISNGPRPVDAEVPSLIGELLSNAKSMLEDKGLTVGTIQNRASATAQPGSVLEQSAAPGTRIPFDKAVDLVVATGSGSQ